MKSIIFEDGMHLSTEVMDFMQQAYMECVRSVAGGADRVLKMPDYGEDGAGWAVYQGKLIRLEGYSGYYDGVYVMVDRQWVDRKDGTTYEALTSVHGFPAGYIGDAEFTIRPQEDENYGHIPYLPLQHNVLGVPTPVTGGIQALGGHDITTSPENSAHIPRPEQDKGYRWRAEGCRATVHFAVQGGDAVFSPGDYVASLEGWRNSVNAKTSLRGRAVFQGQSGDAWRDVVLDVDEQGNVKIGGEGVTEGSVLQGASQIAVYDTGILTN